eukprot:1467621-Pyramimonas_sp.AAC.1
MSTLVIERKGTSRRRRWRLSDREKTVVKVVGLNINQDIRCHVGKERAAQWAAERGDQLLRVAARDRPRQKTARAVGEGGSEAAAH